MPLSVFCERALFLRSMAGFPFPKTKKPSGHKSGGFTLQIFFSLLLITGVDDNLLLESP